MVARYNASEGIEAPASKFSAVTTSDTADLAYVSRALVIGTGGTLTVISEAGDTVLFAAVSDGAILPIKCSRVKATGTTATGIVALF
jgi:hypothetical protein